MRALLLGSLLLLACTRATPGGLARGAGGSGQEDPCGGAAVDPWGFCRGPGGEQLDFTCCPEPAPRPCRERVLRACEVDGLCRWLAPGCGEPALPAEGCFPIDDCTEGACAGGLACHEVVVDPCVGKRCSTCDARASVCLPPECDGGASVIGGTCTAPDGSPQPPACCTWPCRAGGIFCAVLAPECPPGEVPAVWGGCWGPCIPPDRCEECAEEVRCRATGGVWDAGGCGNADCGNARACDPPVPGRVCPIDSAFVDGVGCEPSDACGP